MQDGIILAAILSGVVEAAVVLAVEHSVRRHLPAAKDQMLIEKAGDLGSVEHAGEWLLQGTKNSAYGSWYLLSYALTLCLSSIAGGFLLALMMDWWFGSDAALPPELIWAFAAVVGGAIAAFAFVFVASRQGIAVSERLRWQAAVAGLGFLSALLSPMLAAIAAVLYMGASAIAELRHGPRPSAGNATDQGKSS